MDEHPKKWRYFTEHDLEMDARAIKRSFASHVEYTQAKDEYSVSPLDLFQSLAHTVRDRLLDRWNRTQQRYYKEDCRRVYYLSLEFLLGRLARDGLSNLGLLDEARAALGELDLDLDELLAQEPDAGLGNGGLGRLAACFLDSMATLCIPAMGYGIRYDYGIFRQHIIDGRQVEVPDNWLIFGNPWEIPRAEVVFPVRFGGRVECHAAGEDLLRFRWVDTEEIQAMAYDLLVPGYRNDCVNTLRLWSAKASQELSLWEFNQGEYMAAVHEKNASENISRVLYPSDNTSQGKELRLRQEYFFVSATLQDVLRRHLKVHQSARNLADVAVFQLNDTHPALAIPELMRLLVDEQGLEWDEAWEVTRASMAYTNHTVLPEALEQWSVDLVGRLLPRHLQIIYEINHRFLEQIRSEDLSDEQLRRLSLVAEDGEKRIRMANLAIVGSSSVNGVSELHTQLLRQRIFPDFAALIPERFNAKTNGVTPRRWLTGCNPELAELITRSIGDDWTRDLRALEQLAPLADDQGLGRAFRQVKRLNKERLAGVIRDRCGFEVDPAALFDVQVKRIHEYKRQLLNALCLLAEAEQIKAEGPGQRPPRVAIFSGKAAPGYAMAKLIVRLIHAVADRVNADPEVSGHLRVAFLPNYDVSLAEQIIPAAELSQQISTAGMEASGTGNMKLSLNGALTLGTLDGANVEIMESVGRDNLFIFGLTAEEVSARRSRPRDVAAEVHDEPTLEAVLDLVASGALSPGDRHRYRPLISSLLERGDPYMVIADFAAYRGALGEVLAAYGDPERWTRSALLTVARMGRFSSDLTIARYARDIWHVPVDRIDLER